MSSYNAAVCTLFEGRYHLGLGALVNSLADYGFRGNIYAGYRGDLPPWAERSVEKKNVGKINSKAMIVTESITLYFIESNSDVHFAHFKPKFILDLIDSGNLSENLIFYFDPDITLDFPWVFFEKWAFDSIALCEDVNSPLHRTHPKRQGWKKFLLPHDIKLEKNLDVYINSGFVGFPIMQSEFLSRWWDILQLLIRLNPSFSGLNYPSDYLFWNTDQDALNIILMEKDYPLSIAGREAMSFKEGTSFMAHAIGSPKPWDKNFLRNSLSGHSPNKADKAFFNSTQKPINVISPANLKRRQFALKLASGLGRIFSRN